jgi:hypothetical protein
MKFKCYIFSLFLILGLLSYPAIATSEDFPSPHAEASFIYNVIALTRWPDKVGATINLCVYGEETLEEELKTLREKSVNRRQIVMQHKNQIEDLGDCQVVFIPHSSNENLLFIIDAVKDKPILTIANTKVPEQQGVIINMNIENNKIMFEANLQAARQAGLRISSKLLQLATEVTQ